MDRWDQRVQGGEPFVLQADGPLRVDSGAVVTAVQEQPVSRLLCLPPELDGRLVTLRYRGTAADGSTSELAETVELPGTLEHVDPDARDLTLRLLSLAASLSYFKAFVPGTLEVAGGLTDREREFLDSLVKNGLGEFAYVNDLPEVFDTPIVAAPAAGAAATVGRTTPSPRPPRRLLVAVGGGKDSIVSIEALRSAGYEVVLFSVNSYAPIEATAEVAGLPLRSARRRLDPELFRLNEAGAPNGHVPVTAINSVVAVLTAMALDCDTVVFSNEASSSYGNVVWHGRTINHQWSKGSEFERLLRDVLPADGPDYVSLLRPLTELRIARRFAQLADYHQVFTSCNRAFKLESSARTSWCGDCPKCRFVFLVLAPFLSRAALLEIFGGRDLFADPGQRAGFLELLGVEGLQKPFECVGEPDECRVALGLLATHPDWQGHDGVAELRAGAPAATEADRAEVFRFREHEHFLGPELEAVAREV